jgi:hypothetical protein
MTEKQQVKQWMAWYLQPAINVREVYGDSFEWTALDRIIINQLMAQDNMKELQENV